MSQRDTFCPDCDSDHLTELTRREFVRSAGVAALAVGGLPLAGWGADSPPGAAAKAAKPPATSDLRQAAGKETAESVVKLLYESLSKTQREAICFNWDHQDDDRGLLRTFVANNWNVTNYQINSDFFTGGQRQMIRDIFEGITQPEWHAKFDQQLKDDVGGWGRQSIAIFGAPDSGKFEFVLTSRHMTLRCDGDSADHVAFGGPIFYGHAARGFNEAADHPGNVFWPQALAANGVFDTLDGKQRKLALVRQLPQESDVRFHGPAGALPGIPVTELSADQKDALQKVLAKLVEPYRQSDRDEAMKCLTAQGGLDKCSLAFYSAGDIGGDGVWDNWRLEGPSFVWYFRGAPHVHVWVHVADTPDVKLNA